MWKSISVVLFSSSSDWLQVCVLHLNPIRQCHIQRSNAFLLEENMLRFSHDVGVKTNSVNLICLKTMTLLKRVANLSLRRFSTSGLRFEARH